MFLHKFAISLCLFLQVLASELDHEYVRPYYSPNVTRNYTLRIERNLCVDQPYKYFQLLTCTIRLFRNQQSESRIAGRFLQPQDIVFCRYKIYYRFRTYQPYLLDEWFNYCELFDNVGNVSSISQLAIGSLKSSTSNLPGCPLKGMLNVTHVINEAQFPPFLPAGEYRMDLKFYNGQNETLLAFEMYMTVRSKGAVDLAMG